MKKSPDSIHNKAANAEKTATTAQSKAKNPSTASSGLTPPSLVVDIAEAFINLTEFTLDEGSIKSARATVVQTGTDHLVDHLREFNPKNATSGVFLADIPVHPTQLNLNQYRDAETLLFALSGESSIPKGSLEGAVLSLKTGQPYKKGSNSAAIGLLYDKRSLDQCMSKIGDACASGKMVIPRALAGISAALEGFDLANGSILLLDLGPESSQLISISKSSVTSQNIEVGMKQVLEKIQAILNLKFAGSANRLFYENRYDFADDVSELVAPLVGALKPIVDQEGSKNNFKRLVICGLPFGKDYMSVKIAEGLGLEAIAFPAIAHTEGSNTEVKPDVITSWLAKNHTAFNGAAMPAPWCLNLATAQPALEKTLGDIIKSAPAPAVKAETPVVKATESSKGGFLSSTREKVIVFGGLLVIGGVLTFGHISWQGQKKRLEDERLRTEQIERNRIQEQQRLQEELERAREGSQQQKAMLEELEKEHQEELAAIAEREEQERERLASATGSLRMETYPEGVAVYIDNQYVGTTPCRIDDIKIGKKEIELQKDGYKSSTIQVYIPADELIVPGMVTLEPMTCSVQIESSPNGVPYILYFTDSKGEKMEISAGVTPDTVSGLDTFGAYSVEFNRQGWESRSNQARLTPGDNHTFSEHYAEGSVLFEVYPAGANVFIDKVKLSADALDQPYVLKAGEHEVFAVLEDYEPYTATFTVVDGETTTESVRLQSFDRIIPSSKVDEPPHPLKTVQPKLPDSYKDSMTVYAVFVINRDGTTTDIHIRDCEDEVIREATITAIQQWQFTPAKRMGRDVRTRVALPIRINPEK